VRPQAGDVSSQSLDKDARLSSQFLGVNVASARDGPWGCLQFTLLYFAAKPTHVGANVDGLACLLHRPTI
jgi:hypothetical protein